MIRKTPYLILSALLVLQLNTANAMVGYFSSPTTTNAEGGSVSEHGLDLHSLVDDHKSYLVGAGLIIGMVGLGVQCCFTGSDEVIDLDSGTVKHKSRLSCAGLSLLTAGLIMGAEPAMNFGKLLPVKTPAEGQSIGIDDASELNAWNLYVSRIEAARQTLVKQIAQMADASESAKMNHIDQFWNQLFKEVASFDKANGEKAEIAFGKVRAHINQELLGSCAK